MPAVLFRPTAAFDETDWLPVLREAFKDVDFRVWPAEAADVEYLISWKLLEGDRARWPKLKAVLALGAGVNQFTGHPEMPPHAALVRMLEPGLAQGMAEYVASFVLRFHRDHDMLAAKQAAREWFDYTPKLAHQRRVGFMGLGRMALPCIETLKPFGFDLRGWSRTAKAIEGVKCFSGADELDAFLSETDILVCLLPLTKETENILNRDTLSRLPQGAFLINAGRGKLLVEDDLIPLLDSGHIEAAALDVFRREPLPPEHPFWTHPKIHATSHIAAITMPDTGAALLRQVVEEMERGERPEGLVDVGRGY